MDHVAKANQLFVDENYTKAANEYSSAISKLMGVTQFPALFGRAKCRLELNHIDSAITDLSECLSINPKHRLSNYYLGYYLLKQNPNNLKQLKNAKKFLEIANNTGNKQNRMEHALNKVSKKLKNLSNEEEKEKEKENIYSATKRTTNIQNENGTINQPSKENGTQKTQTQTTKTQNETQTKSQSPNQIETETEKEKEKQAPSIRDNWYQSATTLTYTLYVKNLTKDDVNIIFKSNSINMSLKLANNNEPYSRTIQLFGEIIPDKCKFSVTKYKINCLLAKRVPTEWVKLEKNSNSKEKSKNSTPWTTSRNWEEVTDYASRELEKEKPEGDEALQSLFQKIYGDADDDQRRAMVKSFQTSGGTVLSTNWGDVKSKDYQGKDKVLPTGQNVKKWEY